MSFTPFKRAFAPALLVCVSFQSPPSFAMEDAVVVTATRFPERALDAPIGMTVISASRIAASTASTLPELLSQEAGIVANRHAWVRHDRRSEHAGTVEWAAHE
jgi:outer membrane cobalamin receptor